MRWSTTRFFAEFLLRNTPAIGSSISSYDNYQAMAASPLGSVLSYRTCHSACKKRWGLVCVKVKSGQFESVRCSERKENGQKDFAFSLKRGWLLFERRGQGSDILFRIYSRRVEWRSAEWRGCLSRSRLAEDRRRNLEPFEMKLLFQRREISRLGDKGGTYVPSRFCGFCLHSSGLGCQGNGSDGTPRGRW